MKGCLNNPRTRITERDARTVSRFRAELELLAKVKSDGHTRECASLQVFENMTCSCKGDPTP